MAEPEEHPTEAEIDALTNRIKAGLVPSDDPTFTNAMLFLREEVPGYGFVPEPRVIASKMLAIAYGNLLTPDREALALAAPLAVVAINRAVSSLDGPILVARLGPPLHEVPGGAGLTVSEALRALADRLDHWASDTLVDRLLDPPVVDPPVWDGSRRRFAGERDDPPQGAT